MSMNQRSMDEPESGLLEFAEQGLALLLRRRWWVILTFGIVSVGGYFALQVIPVEYESEATIVRYQPVSQGYVFAANPVITNSEVVEATAREVVSRPKLVAIIKELDLYSKARQAGRAPEALVKRMLKDLSIVPNEPNRPTGEATAFRITFAAPSADLAQSVVSRIVQAFVDASITAGGNRAERTTRFLKEQVETAKDKLVEQEQRLRDFKSKFGGELPEQTQVNLVALADLRTQLQATLGSLGRAQQQRASLDSSLNSSLNRLRSDRANLLQRFTSKHPEVVKIDQEIAKSEATLSSLRTAVSAPAGALNSALGADPALADLIKQADANSLEIASLFKEEARLRTEIGLYQNRLNAIPIRDQQLASLQRDYEALKLDYTALLSKQRQSELASNLEERGEGLQFRLVEPPTLPIEPSSPNRRKVGLGAAVGGLMLGVILALARDLRDSSFHNEKDLRRAYEASLVVSIPVLLTDQEEFYRNWKRKFEWVAGSVIMVTVLIAEYMMFRSA
jgi:polysaccharide biosynthesis transport protein